MKETVKIPEISENVNSGKVVSVLVKVGDAVVVDDVLIEFETEKALVEIPSTVAGTIVALVAEEGMEMKVGDVIAEVETDAAEARAEDSKPAQSGEDDEEEDEREPRDTEKPKTAEAKTADDEILEDKKRESREKAKDSGTYRPPAPAAPSIRRFARELGIDIHLVRGTGPGGRITHDDVKAFVKQRGVGKGQDRSTISESSPELPDFSRWGDIEIVDLPAVRRLTADSTSLSWRLVPHVTQFDQADISAVERFLSEKGAKLQKEGVKLTITALVACVCAAALRKFPKFNASIDMTNNRLIYKQYVHIGIATDTERGLLVPVLREADKKSIRQMAVEIADLAQRARNKKIKPDEMTGGTFTISNQGGIGGTQFTPIVMWPQAAILGISRTSVMPVYVDGVFEPRSILPLALSYDHRIIDGAEASRFLKWICDSLAQPFNMHLD